MNSSRAVRWPLRYSPTIAPVFVHNELEMDAPPEVVWAWLIRAQRWPAWYENASGVTFLSGTPPDLSADARFRWTTFGVRLESTVQEFVPGERIAWDARCIGVDAYHAWVIGRTPAGSHVLTEETQHGWLARLGASLMPRRMHTYHQIWLEQLCEVARKGFPPPA
jgi:Polyketide cyclase / dehydrase and lipid transport